MKVKDYYQMLGITPFSSDMEIKRAYHKMLQEYHPDKKHGHNTFAGKRFQAAMEAYEAIKTPEKRAKYDELLKIQISSEKNTLSARQLRDKRPENDNKQANNNNGIMNWFLKPFKNKENTGF